MALHSRTLKERKKHAKGLSKRKSLEKPSGSSLKKETTHQEPESASDQRTRNNANPPKSAASAVVAAKGDAPQLSMSVHDEGDEPSSNSDDDSGPPSGEPKQEPEDAEGKLIRHEQKEDSGSTDAPNEPLSSVAMDQLASWTKPGHHTEETLGQTPDFDKVSQAIDSLRLPACLTPANPSTAIADAPEILETGGDQPQENPTLLSSAEEWQRLAEANLAVPTFQEALNAGIQGSGEGDAESQSDDYSDVEEGDDEGDNEPGQIDLVSVAVLARKAIEIASNSQRNCESFFGDMRENLSALSDQVMRDRVQAQDQYMHVIDQREQAVKSKLDESRQEVAALATLVAQLEYKCQGLTGYKEPDPQRMDRFMNQQATGSVVSSSINTPVQPPPSSDPEPPATLRRGQFYMGQKKAPGYDELPTQVLSKLIQAKLVYTRKAGGYMVLMPLKRALSYLETEK